MFKEFGMRDIIALIIMFLFASVFVASGATSPGYEETLKNIVLIAVGFYLGGSKVGSDTATVNAKTVSTAAKTTGGLAPNEDKAPVPVKVINEGDEPVPVDPKPE